VKCKSFYKIYRLVAEIQKFKKLNLKTSLSNMWTPIAYWNEYRHRATVQFLSRNARFHLTIDIWPSNSRDLNPVDYEVWGVLAPATPPLHQDTRRRRSEAANGVSSVRTSSTEQWHRRALDCKTATITGRGVAMYMTGCRTKKWFFYTPRRLGYLPPWVSPTITPKNRIPKEKSRLMGRGRH